MMGYKSELLEKLIKAAENPQNEFDCIIAENRTVLRSMDENLLSEIYALRRKAERLCGKIPYSRDELKLLIRCGEVSTDGLIAELEDCFETADYVFSKAGGKDF